MTNLDKAKELFQTGEYTCVLCREDVVYSSKLPGISPMLDFIASNTDLNGFSAVDKIVGKAAAMLFVLAGVCEVHAGVMSDDAVTVFQTHHVRYSFDKLTAAINNRFGTGLCPMELAVKDIDNPAEALQAVKVTLEELKKNR